MADDAPELDLRRQVADPGAHEVQHVPPGAEAVPVEVRERGDEAVVHVRHQARERVEVAVRPRVQLRAALGREHQAPDAAGGGRGGRRGLGVVGASWRRRGPERAPRPRGVLQRLGRSAQHGGRVERAGSPVARFRVLCYHRVEASFLFEKSYYLVELLSVRV